MNIANGPFHALQGVARSVKRRPASIDLKRALRDFCGMDATKLSAFIGIGDRFAAAACGQSRPIDADQVALLKGIVEHLEDELAAAPFLVPDDKPDQQHSPDESHHLDRERL